MGVPSIGRDVHAEKSKFKLVWVVCKLLRAIVFLHAGVHTKDESVECPVGYEDYLADPSVEFASLHPCAPHPCDFSRPSAPRSTSDAAASSRQVCTI